MLRELAYVMRPLSITFERWQSGEVPEDWEKAKVTPAFKKGRLENLGKYRSVTLTSVPGKAIEQTILESISKHMKDKKQRFMEGKTCLTDLRAFHNDMTGLVDEGSSGCGLF